MQSSSPKVYLKDLKIQRNYLQKFCNNKASEWLRSDIIKCIEAFDNEISDYENLIMYSVLKQKSNENNLSIYDFIGGD